MTALLEQLHPERISVCFARPLSADVLNSLVREPRFKGRLIDLIALHYRLDAEDALSGADASHLHVMTLEDIEALVIRAGAVVNSRAFAQEIRGPVIQAMSERFGSEILHVARKHLEMGLARAAPSDLDELADRVLADGRDCVAAWLCALPLSTQKLLRLKWPNDSDVPEVQDEALCELGQTIINRLMKDSGAVSE